MPRLKNAPRRKPTTAEVSQPLILYPRLNADDVVVLSVDPGDEHVGLALGCRYMTECPRCEGDRADPDSPGDYDVAVHMHNPYTREPCMECNGAGYLVHEPGWRVYDTAEMTPDAFVEWFRGNCAGIDMLVIEKFILFPSLVNEQTGSEMKTSKLVGWLEWYCKWDAPHISITEYTSQVLSGPTASLVADSKEEGGLGEPWVSPPGPNKSKGSTGDHQRSAETHWWHALIRAGLVPGLTLA